MHHAQIGNAIRRGKDTYEDLCLSLLAKLAKERQLVYTMWVDSNNDVVDEPYVGWLDLGDGMIWDKNLADNGRFITSWK